MDAENIETLLKKRALDMFKICDIENKGFINRIDFHRLKETLGESPETLNELFVSLDNKKKGYLDMDDIIFALRGSLDDSFEQNDSPSENDDSAFDNNTCLSPILEEDENAFYDDTMIALGATNMLQE